MIVCCDELEILVCHVGIRINYKLITIQLLLVRAKKHPLEMPWHKYLYLCELSFC